MAIEEQSANDAHAAHDTAAPMSPKGASRRRFAKTGVGVGGVLLTLKSHAASCVGAGLPVAVSGYQSYVAAGCATPMTSHFVTVSKRDPKYGKLPSYWVSCSSAWGAAPVSWPGMGSTTCANTPFWRVFGSGAKTAVYTNTNGTYMTMLDVCQGKAKDSGIGQACVAAYLNATVLSPKIVYLPKETVINIFLAINSGGGATYFPPSNTSGVNGWSKLTCVAYLLGTMA